MAFSWSGGSGGVRRRKSKSIKLSKKGNPTSRPFFSRIAGMITTLLITLGLIGFVIFLRKTLPNGSKPSFDPTSLRSRQDGVPAEKEIGARQFTFELPSFTMPVLQFSSTVSCTTWVIPAKMVKRGGRVETSCSTSYFAIPQTPTATSSARFPLIPTTFRIPSLILPETTTPLQPGPCVTSSVYCRDDTPRRGCRPYTVYFSVTGCGISTSTTTITTRPPDITTTTTTSTSTHVITTTSTTSTIPPITTTSPPTRRPINPCISTSVSCETYPVILRNVKRQVYTECITSFVTRSECLTTSTSTTSSTSTTTSSTTTPSTTSTTTTTTSSTTSSIIDSTTTSTTSSTTDSTSTSTTSSTTDSTSTSTTSSTTSTATTSPTISTSLTTSTSLTEPITSDTSTTFTDSTTETTSTTSVTETTSTTSVTETTSTTSATETTSTTSATETTSTTSATETTSTTSATETTSTTSATETTTDSNTHTSPETSSSTPTPSSISTDFSMSETTSGTVTPSTSLSETSESTSESETTTDTQSRSTSISSPTTELPSTTDIISTTPTETSISTTDTVSPIPRTTLSDSTSSMTSALTSSPTYAVTSASESNTDSSSSATKVITSEATQETESASSVSSVSEASGTSSSFRIAKVSSTAKDTTSESQSFTLTEPTQTQTQSTDPPTSPLKTTPSATDSSPITETSTPLSTATSSSPTSSSPTSSQASTSQTATSLQSSQSESTSTASTSPTLIAQTSTSSAATPSSSPNSTSSDPLTSHWPEQPWHISTTVKGNHAPLIIGRGTVFLLSAMYNQLITHDPVRQLSSVGGISGPDLLGGGSYSSHIGIFAAQLGTIFAAGGTFLDTSHCTTDNETNCDPKLSGTPWVLDIVICVLVIQAGVIVYAASKWFQKPGRLSADPTTIAGVVVVMGHPEVERLFGGFPGELSEGELRERLREHRFKLGMFETLEGVEKYGIVPVPITERKEQSKFGKAREALEKLVFWRDWKLNRLAMDLLFASLLVGLLGLTLACIASVDQPRRIFAAAAPTGTKGGVGMKILFAFVGVIISSNWGRLFQDTQTFTPYFPLRDGGARPNPTILLSRHTSPLCAFLPLLRNRHLAAASVAFTGLISEFLIIALAGLPYRAGQLRSEFLFCGITSVVILSIMLAQLVLVMIWRRRLPHLPRRPDTIAAVMTYVADTSMVKDFRGLEEMSTKDRNRAIIEMGKVYAYGWRQEPEGRGIRWLVDEVQDSEKKSFLSEGRPSAEPGQDPGLRGYYGRPEGYHSGYGRDV